jgi:hypothetical protein
VTDIDQTVTGLTDGGGCGCCAGVHVVTPRNTDNLPGSDRLRYRVGTAASFLESMRTRIGALLPDLRTRRTDDPSIALLDAWACALDVLTFYDERIITESYLRTAVEGLSLTELARTVGYQRSPGVAAPTWLQFTLEDGDGAPAQVPIPIGTKVASLPGPGELPQTFETVGSATARPEWNAFSVKQTGSPVAGFARGRLYVAGAATTIRVGETLLFRGPGGFELHTVRRVTLLPTGVTEVDWGAAVPATHDEVHVLHQRAAVFGASAPDWRSLPDTIRANYLDQPSGGLLSELSDKASDKVSDPLSDKTNAIIIVPPIKVTPVTEWPHFRVSTAADRLDLDAGYPSLIPGGLVVLTLGSTSSVCMIGAVAGAARSDFGISARITSLTLESSMPAATVAASPRNVGVLAGSERLTLTGAPLAIPVESQVLDLATGIPPLTKGQSVLLVGRAPRMRVDSAALQFVATAGAASTLQRGELLTVTGPGTTVGAGTTWPVLRGTDTGTVTVTDADVTFVPVPDDSPVIVERSLVDLTTRHDSDGATLQLQQSLTNSYDRASLQVSANVAPATHGETKNETLGSGNAGATFQGFALAQFPLTYVASTTTGTGVASTLQVLVDGNRWTEVPSLFGCRPTDRVYTVRIADDDKVTVGFGDGITGARLPTGVQNVTATYRVGTGSAGAVAARQLTLLMTRPLGVRGVTNPMPAGLCADPDSPAMVRRNAPRTALAFDRVVSLLDYEDFVRAIPGFAKAQAAALLVNGAGTVHLTVVGQQGAPVTTNEQADLKTTIKSVGNDRQALAVDSAEQIGFYVRLTCVVDPAADAGAVTSAVRGALQVNFGFDARDLGQPVTATEVLAVAQRVPGVVAVNLTLLDTTPNGGRQAVLPARTARADGTTIRPAQLLTVAPDGIDVVASAKVGSA